MLPPKLGRFVGHFLKNEYQAFLARKCLYRMLYVDLISDELIESLMRNNIESICHGAGSRHSPDNTARIPAPFQSITWTFLEYVYAYWHTYLIISPEDSDMVSLIT